MFIIGLIVGFVLCLMFISLMNLAVKHRIEKGEKLVNYGDELLKTKLKLHEQLNELTNGR
jgi:hypothetical protein